MDRFQFRLLAVNLVYFLAILMAFAGMVFAPIMKGLDSRAPFSVEEKELANLFLYLDQTFWPAILVLFLLLLAHSLIVSHRIMGPLYRFRKILRAVAKGDLSVQAKLRKHDYLQREMESVKEMVESLRKSIADLVEQSDKVAAVLPQIRTDVEHVPREEIGQSLEELETQVQGLRSCLAHFKIGRESPGMALAGRDRSRTKRASAA